MTLSSGRSPSQLPDDKLYVSLDDAVELTGFAAHYLRRLITEKRIRARGALRAPLIAWADVQRLASEQRPFWVLLNGEGDPESLLFDAPHAEDAPVTMVPLEDDGAAAPSWLDTPVSTANALDWLRSAPQEIAQTAITSPPYWGQRRYADETAVSWADGSQEAFGREATVEAYVRHTLEILRAIKRVLRKDGTIWWAMGDTYQTRTIVRESTTERWENYQGKRTTTWAGNPNRRHSAGHPFLKDKDLTLAPFLIAHGAQHIGLYVRAVIIWSKQKATTSDVHKEPSRTHMPESVQDRPTTGHEYILLMARSDRYYYTPTLAPADHEAGVDPVDGLRTVWSFPVSTNHGGHTAAFPLELPERCLKLSTRPGDLVIDPFAGSGNTLIAAKRLGRRYAGCDISPSYVRLALDRLGTTSRIVVPKVPAVEQFVPPAGDGNHEQAPASVKPPGP